MAEEQGQEKTEEATAKRRDDFRKKGEVAQSKEVNTALLLASSILLWYFYAESFWTDLTKLIEHLLDNSGAFLITPESTVQLLLFVLRQGAALIMPLWFLVLVVGFLSSFVQIGWLVTGKPLVPDMKKLDPIKGAARFVSKRSLVELLKSLVKVGVVGYVAYSTVANEFQRALELVNMEVINTLSYVGDVALVILLKCCGVMLLLALIDFIFVRWEMEEKMKI
mgnify:FL=1